MKKIITTVILAAMLAALSGCNTNSVNPGTSSDTNVTDSNSTDSTSDTENDNTSSESENNSTSSEDKNNSTSSGDKNNSTSSGDKNNSTSSGDKNNSTSSGDKNNSTSSGDKNNSTSSGDKNNSSSSGDKNNSTSSEDKNNSSSSGDKNNSSSSGDKNNSSSSGDKNNSSSSDDTANDNGSETPEPESKKLADRLNAVFSQFDCFSPNTGMPMIVSGPDTEALQEVFPTPADPENRTHCVSMIEEGTSTAQWLVPQLNLDDCEDYVIACPMISASLKQFVIVKPKAGKENEVKAALSEFAELASTPNPIEYPAWEAERAGTKFGTTSDGCFYIVVAKEGEEMGQVIENA